MNFSEMKPLIENRECGTCFECCIHTGVEAKASAGRIALRTYPGKPCLHMRPDHPAAACAVYSRRPHACERYKCVWLQGILPDEDLRPNISGVILGFYSADENGNATSATVTVCNPDKCGELSNIASPLGRIISYASQLVSDIKIVNYISRKVIYLKDGKIYSGKLTKPDGGPESLEFTFGPSIGHYELKNHG